VRQFSESWMLFLVRSKVSTFCDGVVIRVILQISLSLTVFRFLVRSNKFLRFAMES
jgi:hypothetical protein